jgi:hypothetical protein
MSPSPPPSRIWRHEHTLQDTCTQSTITSSSSSVFRIIQSKHDEEKNYSHLHPHPITPQLPLLYLFTQRPSRTHCLDQMVRNWPQRTTLSLTGTSTNFKHGAMRSSSQPKPHATRSHASSRKCTVKKHQPRIQSVRCRQRQLSQN